MKQSRLYLQQWPMGTEVKEVGGRSLIIFSISFVVIVLFYVFVSSGINSVT